ncbi:MAG: hypothetical protein NTW21_13335, partial [Verrucomicrobia bacterium]|nr:hypothetical protein [Verrucomicrobiota bacterium]
GEAATPYQATGRAARPRAAHWSARMGGASARHQASARRARRSGIFMGVPAAGPVRARRGRHALPLRR